MLAPGFYPQHFHMPTRSSPLSERSANATPQPFQFTMSTPVQTDNKSVNAPQRAYKPNPALQTRDAATKRRRDMFFKRVQKDRDDKKWEARGEQIQRLDHIGEQKRWAAEKMRQAPQVDDSVVDEELYEIAPEESNQEMNEVDYILAQEEQAMQELIASMEEEQDASHNYGSDEEDYDQLFQEYTSTLPEQSWQQHHHQQQQQQQHQSSFQHDNSMSGADADEMDMS